jgi:hypothetical protein
MTWVHTFGARVLLLSRLYSNWAIFLIKWFQKECNNNNNNNDKKKKKPDPVS